MRLLPTHAAILTAASLLAGCAPQGDFPSLARRPAEDDRSVEEPVRPAVEVARDEALRARVAELRGQAGAGDRAFDNAYAAAEAAVARAGTRESESWIEAQQALSRLEATREATMRAVAELDQLAIGRIDAPTNEEDFSAINEAIAAAERIALAQQDRYDRLRGRLANR
jgi:hypothetical protein